MGLTLEQPSLAHRTPRSCREVKMGYSEELRDIFDEVDTEKMGDIYQRELIVYLKELHGGKFANLKLQVFMNNLEDDGDKILDFENFLILMDRCKNAGWTKYKEDKNVITDEDLTKTFKKMDLDNSGRISKRELKMAVKFLGKQYGLNDAKAWVTLMKEADDGDGTLTYEEFNEMVRKAQKVMGGESS